MTVQDLPALNASLNALAAVWLVAGYFCIRRRRIALHRACMIAALASSAAFLTSYVIYHYYTGSRPFPGTGAMRALYLTILFSHVVLAVAIVPLALITLSRALQARFAQHRAIARWTLPLWLYVSVTGVLVYLMLYRWN